MPLVRILAVLLTHISSVVYAQTPFAAYDMASEAVLNDPHDLAFGPDGRLYVADKFGDRIAVMDPDTLELLSGIGGGLFPGIHDISFGPDGLAHVAVTGLNRVDVIEVSENTFRSVSSLPGLSRTEGVLAHSNGRIYAMASGTGELVAFDQGEPVRVVTGLFGAHDVAEAPDGSIWVAANRQSAVIQFDQQLQVQEVLNHPEFGFIGPRYMDIDDFGRLVVADQDAHRVLMIDPSQPEGSRVIGVIGDGTPGMGPGKFDDPEGVAIRGNSYFFADSDNNRIVRYSVVTN